MYAHITGKKPAGDSSISTEKDEEDMRETHSNHDVIDEFSVHRVNSFP